MNIGATKHHRLLWICYIYLVMVWPMDGLVHVQIETIFSSCGVTGPLCALVMERLPTFEVALNSSFNNLSLKGCKQIKA
jgi:hypothetical protein